MPSWIEVDEVQPFVNLNGKQTSAVALLSSGITVCAVASDVGVSRQTVSRWIHHHPGFQAALNRARFERAATISDQIRRGDELALGSLIERMTSGDEKAAIEWLRLRRFSHEQTPPIGPRSSSHLLASLVNEVHERPENGDVLVSAIERGERRLTDSEALAYVISELAEALGSPVGDDGQDVADSSAAPGSSSA